MEFDKNDTAVVMIDPQNEVLSETGLGWPLLSESLHENNTVENRERIFKAAKEFGFEFIPFDTVKSLSCDKSCNFGKAEVASVLSAKILEITDWKPYQQPASCAISCGRLRAYAGER